MVSCKSRFLVAVIGVLSAHWTLCGCGSPGSSSGGQISNSNGVTSSGPIFPGGIGVSPDLFGSQGVAIDSDNHVYISSTQQLTAYGKDWGVLWSNTNPLSGMRSGVTHLGDVAYYNGYIYGPVEAWNGCNSFLPAVLAVYDAKTGQLVTWSDITADGHEASSVAVVPSTNQMVVSSFCSAENGNATLWTYDLNALTTNAPGSTMTYTGTITLSTAIPLIQGISWDATANQFAISADVGGNAGSLWLASATGTVSGPIYVIPSATGLELEGLDYSSGILYYLENGYVTGIGPVPATPTFSVAPGAYCGTQTVAIVDATAGATIYYTTDGSTPTTSSTVFSAPLTVAASETVRAMAMAGGLAGSGQATAAYTIQTSGCSAAMVSH